MQSKRRCASSDSESGESEDDDDEDEEEQKDCDDGAMFSDFKTQAAAPMQVEMEQESL